VVLVFRTPWNHSVFAGCSELFVCRLCWQRLTKFERASDKLAEIKQELVDVFSKREKPRAKRCLRAQVDEQTPDAILDRILQSIEMP